MPECHDCGRPWPGAVPEDGLCGGCRRGAAQVAETDDRAAAEAREAAARLSQANMAWERRKVEAAAEKAEEERQRRDAETAAEDARREGDEAFARLREDMAREHPELITHAAQAPTPPF